MKDKPFIVTNVTTGHSRLIKAPSRAKLADFILKDSFVIKPAKADDLLQAIENDLPIETIGQAELAESAESAEGAEDQQELTLNENEF